MKEPHIRRKGEAVAVENVSDSGTIVRKPLVLKEGQYLDELFKTEWKLECLPVNTIINKGRCGVGGTTFEINAQRHSIILVPLRSIITSKVSADVDNRILGFHFGITKKDVKDYLQHIDRQEGKRFYKIFSTVESLGRLIHWLVELGLESIYKDFTLLFDEYHTAITEFSYRKALSNFSLIHNFENKILLSATGLPISDYKLNQLEKIDIEAPKHQDLLNLLESRSPINATIDNILKHGKSCDSHVFVNSIEAIRMMISELKRTNSNFANSDFSIWCSASRTEDMNRFKDEGISCNTDLSTVNFYTSAYFEGWDLKTDGESRLYLISNPNELGMCIDIKTRGYQAFGRLRKTAIKLHHVFSTLPLQERDKDFVQRAYSDSLIEKANLLSKAYSMVKRSGSDPIKEVLQEAFSSSKSFENIIYYNEGEDSFDVNYFGVDYESNERRSKLDYSSFETIKKAWQEMGFVNFYEEQDIEMPESDLLTKERYTTKDNMDIFNRLNGGENLESSINRNKLILYKDILAVVGMPTIQELNANIKTLTNKLNAMHIEYVSMNISKGEFEGLRSALKTTFKHDGEAYLSEIPAKLEQCFVDAGLHCYSTLKGNSLEKFFEVKPCNPKTTDGKTRARGYRIISPKF